MANKRMYVLMVLAALFWSGAFITGKITIHEFPPFALTFFRFLFALPFIFAILYIKERDNFLPRKKEIPSLILLGFVGTFLYHVLFFFSLKYTTAINSSLIGATNPMITTVLAVIFAEENIGIKRVIGILMSFTGVFLIVTKGDLATITNLQLNIGDIFMFVGVCFFASYTVLSRKVMSKYQIPPIKVTAYTFLVCTLVTIPFLAWENPATYIQQTTIWGWIAILYMAVFASVLGYLFQLMAIQEIGAPKAAVFINLVPIFTIIQSIVLLGENFDFHKFISAVIIISGVYLTTRPEHKRSYEND